MTNTVYVTEVKDFADIAFNREYELLDVQILSQDKLCLKYRKHSDFLEDSAFTNPVIAAWVTAQARLKLYEYLEALQDRVLYMDTGMCFIFQALI